MFPLITIILLICIHGHGVHAQCNAMAGAARCTSTTYVDKLTVNGVPNTNVAAIRCAAHGQPCQDMYEAYKARCDGTKYKLSCSKSDTSHIDIKLGNPNPQGTYACKTKADCQALSQAGAQGAAIHQATIVNINACINGRTTWDAQCDPAKVATHDEAVAGARNALANCNTLLTFMTDLSQKFAAFALDGRALVEVSDQDHQRVNHIRSRFKNHKHSEQVSLQAA